MGAAGRVLGQITLQHFLLQYRHVCGMTATAEVAATELEEIYGLEVQVADPNKPCIRADHADVPLPAARALVQSGMANDLAIGEGEQWQRRHRAEANHEQGDAGAVMRKRR